MRKTELESTLQRRMQSTLRDYNCYVFKNNGNIFTEVGRPDLVACVPVKIDTLIKLIEKHILYEDDKVGIFLALEVKRKDQLDDVSEAQTIVGEKIKSSSGLWFPMDDLNSVIGLLEVLEAKKKNGK